jgi:hypothetical protein
MSIFQDWLRQRQLREGINEPVDRFRFDTDNEDYADDYEHIQQEVFKVVMSKYPDETMEFLNGIAARGDEEVAELVRKLQKDKPGKPKEPQHPSEEDEVVPSSADSGYNNAFGGGD